MEARKLIAGDELTVKAGNHITASGIVISGKDMLLKADDNNNGIGVITVGGDVETKQGDLTLNGDVIANGTGNQLFNANALGKQLIVKGTITKNTSGDLTLQGGRLNKADDTEIDIILRGDVAVNKGSLIIGLDGADDDTVVKAGVTLSARDNVTVKDSLKGEGALSLDAGNNLNLHKGVTAVDYLSLVAGNEVISGGPIGVTGSDLIIQQGLPIDTADYIFANQGSTDLTLISDTGSVTSNLAKSENAADEWASIGADAATDITLEGNSSIRLGNSGTPGMSLLAGGNIEVDSAYNVTTVTANKNIDAGGYVDIDALHGIFLGGNVNADGYLKLQSDTDHWYGDDVEVDGTLTSGGYMEIGGEDVILRDTATSGGTMRIVAHGDYVDGGLGRGVYDKGGDVDAYGQLTTLNPGGNMVVTAKDDIRLHDTGISATANGNINLVADDLGIQGSQGGDITVDGLLETKLDSGGNIYAGASDDIKLHGMSTSARADGTLTLIANSDSKLGGNLDVDGDLYGNMALSGYDVTVDGDVTSFGILTVDADDDIRLKSDVSSDGAMTMNAGDNIRLNEDGGNTSSGGTMTLNAGLDHPWFDLFDDMSGSIKIEGDAESGGSMTMTAIGDDEFLFGTDVMSGSIKIEGYAKSKYDMDMTATGGNKSFALDLATDVMNGSISIGEYAKSRRGNMTMSANGGDVSGTVSLLGPDIVLMNGSIKIGGDVTSMSNMNLSAKGGSDILTADNFDIDGMNGSIWIEGDAISLGSVTMTAEGGSEILTYDEWDVDGMNGSIKIGGDVTSMFSMNLSAKGGSELGTLDIFDIDIMNGSIKIGGDAESWFGGVTMTAEGGKEILSADLVDFDLMNGSIKIGGHVKSKYDLELTAKGGYEFLTVDGLDFDLMNGSICIGDYVRSKNGAVTLTAEGTSEILTLDGLDLDLMNGSIFVGGSVESQDDTIISAQGGQKIWSGDYYDFSLLSGDVVVLGDIQSYGGNVEIYSSDNTTYLGGDVTAYTDVLLNNKTVFIGSDDQHVTAGTGEITGTITANNTLDKCDQSLYLLAYDDIRLAGDVTGHNGGVSIIAKTGKIFTPGGADDTLNVAITGYSNHAEGAGVVLPKDYDIPVGDENRGRAAIVIMSEADLKLGPDAELTACGVYDDTHIDGVSVDDRPGVDFLDHIEGYKNPGWPIDVAIYLASNAGNVSVGSTVNPIPTGGVMVVDAYHTVSPFGTDFLSSVIAGNVSWLEVCSRITPTLNHAIIYGTLPYASDPGLYPGAGMYVLRGENLDVGTGAWVLASNKEAPLAGRASAEAEEEEFLEGGCPALMEWLANEIGIPAENIQVAMADAFALNTDIQPCEMCARLKDASTILEDSEGTHIPAMAQVVNEFVAPDAPIAPEQMASIASAMASPEAGTQYAAAGQWLDALAEYVGILNTEMGFAAVESVAFAGKYVTPITEGDNASLVAYVEARLAALGG